MSRIAVVRLLVALTIALGLAPFHAAWGASYQFTTIALQPSHVFGWPEIDAAGRVYFGELSGKSALIRHGDGGSLETILDTPEMTAFSPYWEVNSVGDLAFWGTGPNQTGIYRLLGGSLELIASSADYELNEKVSINDLGVVAFSEGLGLRKIYTSLDLLNPVLQAGPGQAYSQLGTHIALNNQNRLAVQGGIGDDSVVPIVNTDGSLHATIESDELAFLDRLDMNDLGDVLLFTFLEVQSIGAVHLWSDGNFELLADTTNFRNNVDANASVNNAKQVAGYSSTYDFHDGIFTGPDPEADKVIQTGDLLEGSKITSLYFWGGLNDAGQIAFVAQLADGRAGIFRADPVPEPSTFALGILGALGLVAIARRRATR